MRHSIEDAAAATGLSVSQARRRLRVIERQLTGEVTRGDHNKVFLSERGLSILRRAVDVERDNGLGPQDAVKMVSDEVGITDGNGAKAAVTSSHSDVTRELIATLRAQIEDLESDRNHWRELACKLQDQMPMALPAKTGERPDQRPWLLRVLWPVTAIRS